MTEMRDGAIETLETEGHTAYIRTEHVYYETETLIESDEFVSEIATPQESTRKDGE